MKYLFLCLLLVACGGSTPALPKLPAKDACELRTSALVEVALQAGLTCEQAKPGLDLLLAKDPACQEYFGATKVQINCLSPDPLNEP